MGCELILLWFCGVGGHRKDSHLKENAACGRRDDREFKENAVALVRGGECFHGAQPATRQAAKPQIFDYIEGFYNRARLHGSLSYPSPLVFETNLQVQQKLTLNENNQNPLYVFEERSLPGICSTSNGASRASSAGPGVSWWTASAGTPS